jgi:hypothetical protein
MKEFRFLRENTHFTDVIHEVIFTPWDEWVYQNDYRWEIEGFELIGVTSLFYDVMVSMLPIKKRVYRDMIAGTIIIGDIIRPEHPMYNHPNIIDVNDE